jgi:hypothetical protein
MRRNPGKGHRLIRNPEKDYRLKIVPLTSIVEWVGWFSRRASGGANVLFRALRRPVRDPHPSKKTGSSRIWLQRCVTPCKGEMTRDAVEWCQGT